MFAATPPTRTNSTLWRTNTSSAPSGSIGGGSGKAGGVPQPTHRDREICRPRHPLAWLEGEHLLDVRGIRVVLVREPHCQLEPARAHDPLQRLEARLRL